MKRFIPLFQIVLFLLWFASCQQSQVEETQQEKLYQPPSVKGWNILSDQREGAYQTIAVSADYGINHLQLSHHIVHDLREIKDTEKLLLTRELIDEAHDKEVKEVFVWDHSLYPLG